MTGRMPQTLLWLWVPSFVPCGKRGQTDRQDRQTSGCYLFPLRDSDELVGLCIWSTELRNSGIFLACPLSEIAVWPSEFVFFGIKLLWVEIQNLFWRWLSILIGLASLTCLFPWIFWSTWLRTRNPESLLMSLHNFFVLYLVAFWENETLMDTSFQDSGFLVVSSLLPDPYLVYKDLRWFKSLMYVRLWLELIINVVVMAFDCFVCMLVPVAVGHETQLNSGC